MSDFWYFTLRYWPAVLGGVGLLSIPMAILTGKFIAAGKRPECHGCGGTPYHWTRCSACTRDICAHHSDPCKECGEPLCAQCAGATMCLRRTEVEKEAVELA